MHNDPNKLETLLNNDDKTNCSHLNKCKQLFASYKYSSTSFKAFELQLKGLGFEPSQNIVDATLFIELYSMIVLSLNVDFSDQLAQFLYNELGSELVCPIANANKEYFKSKLHLLYIEVRACLTEAMNNEKSLESVGTLTFQGRRYSRLVCEFEFENPETSSNFSSSDIVLLKSTDNSFDYIMAELIEKSRNGTFKLYLSGNLEALKISNRVKIKSKLIYLYNLFFFIKATSVLKSFTSRSFLNESKIKSAIIASNNKELNSLLNSMKISSQSVYECNHDSLIKLSESQRIAVDEALSHEISLILGPPGTGKTTTACEIIKCWLKMNDKSEGKILVCADSNTGVDKINTELSKRGFNCARVGSKTKLISELSNNTNEGKQIRVIDNKGCQVLSSYSECKFKLNRYQIVCSTLCGSQNACLDSLEFKQVLVDESTQATEISVLFCLKPSIKQLVLIGDHNQLPPTVLSKEAINLGLSISLFERLIKFGMKPTLLKEQFRMHPSLIEFSNKHFYDGQIKNIDYTSSFPPIAELNWPNNSVRFMFLDTAIMLNSEIEEFNSFCNLIECKIVLSILKIVAKEGVPKISIGVITPYDAQKNRINSMIEETFEHQSICQVDTIDGFQGMEKDLIIVSLVRSNPDSSIGFLKDYRRLNVSLTRAKRGMIIIGNSETLSKDKLYYGLVEFARLNNVLIKKDK